MKKQTNVFLKQTFFPVDQIRVMLLDPEVKYPLLLSANFLITTTQPLLAAGGDKTSPVAPSLPEPGAFNDSCLQRIAQ